MSEPTITPAPHHGGNILTQTTGPLPNWGWLLVIVGGVGLAFIIPKMFVGKSSASSDTTGSGLGLAVDPTTGLPYAVSGLVPSGGGAGGTWDGGYGGGNGVPPVLPPVTPPPIIPPITPPPGHGPPVSPPPSLLPPGGGDPHGPPVSPPPVSQPPVYYTVPAWPHAGSTLWDIAHIYGTSVAALLALNPQIKNPNLIYAGSKLRVR